VVVGLAASGLLLGAGVVRYRTLSARNEVHTLDRGATVTAPLVTPFGPPRTFAAAATRAKLLGDVDVVVYTTSWCPACKQAKSWMNAHGMAYDERDVEASVAYSRELRSLNPRGSIPTFDVEGQVLVGFSDSALVRAMEQAARRRAERRNY
jgi:glutaredoxin